MPEFLQNPNRNRNLDMYVVHRADSPPDRCPDVHNHGDKWDSIGNYRNLHDAVLKAPLQPAHPCRHCCETVLEIPLASRMSTSGL